MKGILEASGAHWSQAFALSKPYAAYKKTYTNPNTLLAASSEILREMKNDIVEIVRLTDRVVPLQRYTDVTHDLRLYKFPEQLQTMLQEDSYALQEAVEATIRSCRVHEDWHVWISTIIATTESKSNAATTTFHGSFLYPEARQRVVKAVTTTPFKTADAWVASSLASLTRFVANLPVHFSIKVPKTQDDFPRVAHGVLVRREMRTECENNSLLSYCYGMYECSGTYTSRGGVVINTCAPIQGYATSGYCIEQQVDGPTLASQLTKIKGSDLEKLLMVISSTLDHLHRVYGFVHCNLTPHNIILQHLGEKHEVRYMMEGTPCAIVLPFMPRLIHFEDSITLENPWISDKGVPGQSPAIDVYRLYQGILDTLKGKKHTIETAPLEDDVKSLVRAGATGDALLFKKASTVNTIHTYILRRYEGDHKSAPPQGEVHLGNGITHDPIDYRADSEELARSLQVLEDSKPYINSVETARLLRQWLSSYFTEDLYYLGEHAVTLNVLTTYYTAEGNPIPYGSDDKLLLQDEDGRFIVNLTEDGIPVVYNFRGDEVLYEEGFAEASATEEEIDEADEDESVQSEADGDMQSEMDEEEEPIVLRGNKRVIEEDEEEEEEAFASEGEATDEEFEVEEEEEEEE